MKRVEVGALAGQVHLPSKHMVYIKIQCLLGWLNVVDRDSGAKTLLPPSLADAGPTPLTLALLSMKWSAALYSLG